MVIKSLSSVGKWTILIITIYILYEKKLLSLNTVFGIINYAKNKLKNITSIPTTSSRPPEAAVKIDLGNKALNDWFPFDIHESEQKDKVKVVLPKWGVVVVENGSLLVKKAVSGLTEKLASRFMGGNQIIITDPTHPLANPYNDVKLIKAILDGIDDW
jgi:hypothetical protein